MISSFFRKPKQSAKPRTHKPAHNPEAHGPPLTAEEATGNLSEIERRFNAAMKCPAGKNQVFIRSLLTPNGATQPRIALRCSLRRDIGQKPEVFYEHIRDVCCSDPEQCPAYQHFQKRRVET